MSWLAVVLGGSYPNNTRLIQLSIIIFGNGATMGLGFMVHDYLVQWVRVMEDRYSTPSAASLDSQTVPTSVMVNQSVGYDAGKKLKGRKRFTLVDTLGLLMMVRVVAASVPEREGARQLLNQVHTERKRFPRANSDLGRCWFFWRRLCAFNYGLVCLDFRGCFPP